MAAYAGAANDLARSDPGCGLRWSVIAAIGRVESNHGRYGGATLHTDGSIRPVIRGIALDGRPGVAAIGDSDDGALDGDLIFDRAMGPMQFIPSTWRGWASDGNGDGVRDPDNMFDAALAAGRYLCAGDVDTRSAEGLRSAIFRYNQSDAYVSAVISLAQAYQDNEVPVLPDIADATRVDAAPSAEAPVQVTTTPTPPSPVETTPSIPVSTTTPGAPTQSVDPAPGAVCTGAPATSSAPPSVPVTPEGPCTAPNPSG
jgi:hypothetical protein